VRLAWADRLPTPEQDRLCEHQNGLVHHLLKRSNLSEPDPAEEIAPDGSPKISLAVDGDGDAREAACSDAATP